MPTVEELMDFYAPIKETSGLESTLRGIKQGVTLGFGDEITGALESAFTGKSYRLARNEAREADYRAQKSNPLAYGAGELGGGVATAFIPGLGLAKGAGLAAKIGLGAATGATAGLGASTAELTPERFSAASAGQAARDAAVGGAFGAGGAATFHGLGKALGYAGDAARGLGEKATRFATEDAELVGRRALLDAAKEGNEKFAEAARKYAPILARGEKAVRDSVTEEGALRVAKNVTTEDALQMLMSSVGNKAKMKAFGAEGINKSAITSRVRADKDLRVAIAGGDADAPEALKIVRSRLEKYGGRLNKIYDRAEQYSEGGTVDDVVAALDKTRARYAKSVPDRKVADAIAAEMEAYQAQYQPGQRIPLQQLRADYRRFQDVGYGGSVLSPNQGAQMNREIAQAIRGVLHEQVADTAKRVPGLASLAELKALNQRVGAYSAIEDLLSEKATRAASAAPTMGELIAMGNDRSMWREKLKVAADTFLSPKGLIDVAAGAAQKANTTAQTRSARKAAEKVAREALEEVDALTPGSAKVATSASSRELARLIREAQDVRSGKSTHEDLSSQLARALEAGVPRAVAEKIVESYSVGD